MRILLLGKNGLLGSELTKLLATHKKLEAYAVSRKDADITDIERVKYVIEKCKAELVINATGYTKVDQAEKEKNLAIEVNGYAVGRLAKLCASKKIPLIHFSTDYIFGASESDEYILKNGYQEDTKINPLNVYGESKALGEKLLMEHTPYYFLIRSQWLYGKGGKNFVDTMLQLAKTQPNLRVVNDQFGKPTSAHDLAEAIGRHFLGFTAEVAKNNGSTSSIQYGIYHIVNEGITSWFDYAQQIFEFAGIKKEIIPVSSEELNRPAKRPRFSALSNTKLPLLRNWKEALKDYLLKP